MRGWATGLLIVFFALTGCASKTAPPPGTELLSGPLKITGSNTVTPISAAWAETFVKLYPRVDVSVSGPGSGAGIAALINQTANICQSSRSITQQEIDLAKKRGVQPYETVVATDALAIVVNRANPLNELTIDQLSGIYTNQLTNWKDVGGNDTPIVALARDTSSGTHVYFLERVIQMRGLATQNKSLQYGTHVLFLPSTEEGVSEVAGNPNAVFYAGLGFVNSRVKVMAVKKTGSDPAVLPNVQTAQDGTYPVARPLFFYTNGPPDGVIKAFIDYCLSDIGQQIVAEAGYVPLK